MEGYEIRQRPPIPYRTDTPFADTTLFRSLARKMQEIMPHHRKRNNDATARRDQPTHLFPEPEVKPKIDTRNLGGAKLKRGPRHSDAELRERGTLKFVTRIGPEPLLLQRAHRLPSPQLSDPTGAAPPRGQGPTQTLHSP